MKAKKEFILLIIVIIAVSLYLIFHTTDQTHYQLPVVPEIAQKEITKIEISGPEATIVLQKKDNRWLIAPNEYPADPDKVKKMLEVISGLTLTALVSEARNDHLYDLTEDKKITIKAWVEDSLKREFDMGRTAPSWNHTFVKLAGDTRVYHAEGNFRDNFDLTVEKLRDKVVLSFDQKEIKEIEIIKGKQSVVLVKKETPVEDTAKKPEEEKTPSASDKGKTIWENADGEKADADALDNLLSTLSDLSCEKYIEDKEKDAFTEPIYTVKMKGVGEYTLSIFEKTDADENSYPAISSENAYPFMLAKWEAERIMKGPDEMVKKEEDKD